MRLCTPRTLCLTSPQCYALWMIAGLLVSSIAWLAYMSLMAFPIIVLAAGFENGRSDYRASWAMLLSSVLLFALMPFVPTLSGSRLGRVVLELQFAALVLAYLSVYWPVNDTDAIACAARDLAEPSTGAKHG